MEAVGRLAGGIAHDFNNLLTVILGYVEELERTQPSPSVSEVKGAAQRAAQLTSQLLAFSRRQVLQPQPTHLNDLLVNVRGMIERVVGEDVRVETSLAPDLYTVQIDRGQFDQVVLNLVVNARDAMPHGGTLSIETANVQIADKGPHHGIPPGRYVRLTCADTGTGMDRETSDRIFEPFFTTKGADGTGLGLSTVYGIVTQSGGYIHVETEPGHGARFVVLFPRVEAAVIAPEPRPAAPAAGTESILIVEDEPAVRGLLTTVLRRNGYTVFVCCDGREAEEWLETHAEPVDLLVSDVVMPNGSGFDLAQRVRRVRPELKILLISGYSDHVAFGGIDPAEHHAFLQKPFTPATIIRKIRDVLES
jgi:CheY-like chemotaxis protein